MKIAVINDTHMGARGENPFVDEFFFKFWDNVFFPYLRDHNIKTVLHLGDAFERRKFINFKILYNWRTKFFDVFEEMGIDLLMMLGNHDIYHSTTSEVNAMDEIIAGKYENVRIFRDPQDIIIGGKSFAFLPWINEGNLEQTLEFIKNSHSSIAFGHLEISGFEMDRGQVCNEGFPREMFQRFDKVYTGHFHHKSDDGHIYYLGNQYEITWNDYNDQRGFHVFDTETLEMEFIPNPYKLFHKIVYNDDFMDFQHWKGFDFTPYANSYVKVIVIKKQNPYLFDSVLENIYKVKPIDVNVVEDFSDSPITTTPEDKVNQAEDTLTILQRFVDTNVNIQHPEKLKGMLREIYLEALDSEHTA